MKKFFAVFACVCVSFSVACGGSGDDGGETGQGSSAVKSKKVAPPPAPPADVPVDDTAKKTADLFAACKSECDAAWGWPDCTMGNVSDCYAGCTVKPSYVDCYGAVMSYYLCSTPAYDVLSPCSYPGALPPQCEKKAQQMGDCINSYLASHQ